MRSGVVVAAALCCLSTILGVVHAQETVGEPAPSQVPDGALSTEEGKCVVPEGTFVDLEFLAPIGSATVSRSDAFQFVLAHPLAVDGRIVVPAGTAGHGEVVHAEPSRGGGKPGELLLAARYLELGDERIPLRGMKMGLAGRDRTTAVMATSMVIGPFAHFIRGREIEIPAGSRAYARVAATFTHRCTPADVRALPDDSNPGLLEVPEDHIKAAESPAAASSPSTENP